MASLTLFTMKTKASKKGATPKCSVEGCERPADFDVLLVDTRLRGLDSDFCELDRACPHICLAHAEENERRATGISRGREYPFTKGPLCGTGWTEYRDRKTKQLVRLNSNNPPFKSSEYLKLSEERREFLRQQAG